MEEKRETDKIKRNENDLKNLKKMKTYFTSITKESTLNQEDPDTIFKKTYSMVQQLSLSTKTFFEKQPSQYIDGEEDKPFYMRHNRIIYPVDSNDLTISSLEIKTAPHFIQQQKELEAKSKQLDQLEEKQINSFKEFFDILSFSQDQKIAELSKCFSTKVPMEEV